MAGVNLTKMPPKQPPPKKTDTPPANPVDGPTTRLKAQDCAILVDYKLARVIGGQRIGWTWNHRSQFINSRAGDEVSRPFVGVQIFVPRDPNDAATHFGHNNKPNQDHFITLKFWHNTFTYAVEELPIFVRETLPTIMNKENPADRVSVIALMLKDGHRAVLDGFGVPTTTSDPTDSDALFSGGNFDGVKPLLDLAAQREFRIIIPTEKPQKAPGQWLLEFLGVGACNSFDGYETRYVMLWMSSTMVLF